MALEHFDVLIVGAGLSGIDAAYHLRQRCPKRTYAILEGRERVGGTWDLFRYPGIRSDSDMYTMGYSFRPWENPKAISDGAAIREYLLATARDAGIDRHIRFGHRVERASWSSAEARWTVEARVVNVASAALATGGAAETVRLSCSFLFVCAGYYRYAAGYTPEFVGTERFRGALIHPQQWPEGLDYAGKRVLVIGSGATAVTLVPAMARSAAQVTMLQRSPSYFFSLPEEDVVARGLQRVLPAGIAYRLARWKNAGQALLLYLLCRRYPRGMKRLLLRRVSRELGPDYDVALHFTPRYKPWEQRMCVVPDGDLFEAIRRGRASVVTDQIDTFTETGIRLKSGRELEADIVITATGLVLEVLGGIDVRVDGRLADLSKAVSYKGVLFSDIPNLASVFGYINASWTLRADLVCDYVCRLLQHMDARGYAAATPRIGDASMATHPFIENFSSGYMQRSIERWPKQGSRAPWRVPQNYVLDLLSLRFGSVAQPALEFSRADGGGIDH